MSVPWRSMTRDERLGWITEHWRMTVPLLTTLIAVLLMSMPVFTALPVVPHLAMLSVMVWSLFHPQLMPAWLALPLGIVTDAALGLPMGINATLMPVMALGISVSEQRSGQYLFVVEWAAAALLILCYQALTTSLLSTVLGYVDAGPMLFQAVTTGLAYPVMVRIIARVQSRWGVGG